ncbi:hypothetical protein CD175_00625 [Pseudomonas laurylsulfatiphila]|uniref:Uncharacterized protein n=1 Tax=Pseudomonas laurylsulfatiphila TaxID=2011015 RepID=A0A2S6FR71_9PSED|nr:hypothetical protein CD175_00625 [Pseudomonas laurylsulfatiphila]
MPAMVVNDNACDLDERGVLESIASRLAPTVSMSRECVNTQKKGVHQDAQTFFCDCRAAVKGSFRSVGFCHLCGLIVGHP